MAGFVNFMDNEPWPTVQLRDGYKAVFLLGAGDDPESVEDCDIEVRDADGNRWYATALTLAEIRRIMDRHALSGESCHGRFFFCYDLLIVHRGGVPAIAALLDDLVGSGEFKEVLTQLEDDDDDDLFDDPDRIRG